MSRTLLNSAWLLVGLAGCQGLGGYSAQSVTRVPPIGTGTYQVPGSYYGNAGTAPTAGANMMQTSEGMAAAQSYPGAPSNTGWPEAVSSTPSTTTQVSTAGYTDALDEANLSIPAVTPASGSGNIPGNISNNNNLQWQR